MHRLTLNPTRRFADIAAPRAVAMLAGMLLMALRPAFAAEPDAWPVAGRQGIIRLVIVPMAQVTDRAAYDRQIATLCAGQETCFVNFFSNSTQAPLSVPLPDAIDREPTAMLRRSAKQGVDSFRWSCRLKLPNNDCF